MNWKYKAFIQKALDTIPFGRKLNYFMQRNITKNLPVSNATFFEKFDFSYSQLEKIRQFLPLNPDKLKSLEFGAGWDMLTPLSYYLMGVKEQLVIDLYYNMKTDLINNSIQRFADNKETLEDRYNISLEDINRAEIKDFDDLKDNFGIAYMAPVNAAVSGFEDNSFDYITSLSTLEHVPEKDIKPILDECFRILKPGGIFSSIIDLRDHYSYFDRDISIYNFLQFSEKEWKKYNHNLQYQNRLRNKEYKALIESSKFNVMEYLTAKYDEKEKSALERLHLDGKFSNNSPEDNGIKQIWAILQKK